MENQNNEKSVRISEIPQEIFKNFLDKNLTLAAFTGASLLIGSFIFLIYFVSIRYMPDIDLKSATSLLGASAITGGVIYIGLSFSLITPGICYPLFIKGDKKLQFLVKDGRVEGFLRLSTAGFLLLVFILLMLYFILSPEKSQYWYLIFSVLSVLLCTMLLNNILKHENFNLIKKIGISFLLLYYSYMMFFLNLLSSIIIVTVSSKYFTQVKDSFRIACLSLFIYLFCIFLNKFISIDNISKKEKNKNSLKFFQYLLVSFLMFTIIAIPLEAVHVIPEAIVRLYGWGDMKNATLIVDYKGCQVFDAYHIKMEDSCIKNKDTYRVDSVYILLALGKNYLLRCHREVGEIERYHSKIQESNGKNSFSDEIDLTLPASSIISWSRAGL
jgi:hypothetical protein